MNDVRLTILSLPKEPGACRNLQGPILPFNTKTLRALLAELGMLPFWQAFPSLDEAARALLFDEVMPYRQQACAL